MTQFNIEIYTNLSFIEQDIWHDVWQTPCDNEDHILVCIGQLTNLEKDTKTKTKTDHLHSLPCTKLYNLLIMALTSVNETLLIQVQISKVVTLFVCFFVFFHFLSFLVSKLEISACHFKLRLSWLHNQCLFLTFFLHFLYSFYLFRNSANKDRRCVLSDQGKKEINVILEFSY